MPRGPGHNQIMKTYGSALGVLRRILRMLLLTPCLPLLVGNLAHRVAGEASSSSGAEGLHLVSEGLVAAEGIWLWQLQGPPE